MSLTSIVDLEIALSCAKGVMIEAVNMIAAGNADKAASILTDAIEEMDGYDSDDDPEN